MSTLNETTPFWRLSIFAILIGAGLGFSMQTIVIALQNSVDFKDMGVATSSNTFFRSVGSTIGVAIFGSIYSSRLAHYLPLAIQKTAEADPAAMAGATPEKFAQISHNSAILKTFSPALQENVLHAFVQSFHVVFLAAAPVTAVGLIFALILKEVPLRSSAEHHAAKNEAAGEALA